MWLQAKYDTQKKTKTLKNRWKIVIFIWISTLVISWLKWVHVSNVALLLGEEGAGGDPGPPPKFPIINLWASFGGGTGSLSSQSSAISIFGAGLQSIPTSSSLEARPGETCVPPTSPDFNQISLNKNKLFLMIISTTIKTKFDGKKWDFPANFFFFFL